MMCAARRKDLLPAPRGTSPSNQRARPGVLWARCSTRQPSGCWRGGWRQRQALAAYKAGSWSALLLRAELAATSYTAAVETVRHVVRCLGWRWERPEYVKG